MTIEQADKIADVILSAPRVYETPPLFFPKACGVTKDGKAFSEGSYYSAAWLRGFYDFTDEGKGENDGVYSCSKGFGEGYEKIITDWAETPALGWLGRYVTDDDIRMMAYVGIENYRAKILGHRWRFNEKGISNVNDTISYPRGCIVRQDDGKRWIHCRGGNVIPIPGVTIDGWVGSKGGTSSQDPLKWSAMTRRTAFKRPICEHLPLLQGVKLPFNKVTSLEKVAEIEGHNDLVQLRNVWDYPGSKTTDAMYISGNHNMLNYEGQMTVYISDEDGLEDSSEDEPIGDRSAVWVSSNSIMLYYATLNKSNGEKEPMVSTMEYTWNGKTITNTYSRPSVAFKSAFVPLEEGKTYYVYIERTDSRAATVVGKAADITGADLVVVRIPTLAAAPIF